MRSAIRQYLLNPVLLSCTVVFLINQVFDHTGVYIPFVHAYLDDFLTIPLSGAYTLFVQRFLTYRNPAYVLPVWQLIFLWAVFSVWFEWYLPQQSDAYVRNAWDVVAYAVGGVFFHRVINRPQVVD